MQAHAGHVSATMAESATAEMSTIVVVGNNYEESEEGVRELQRSGFACDLIEFGQMVKSQETENQIATLIGPSQSALDVCDRRFVCRMAKKLGCQLCAKK
jgi:hypothetical protein